MTTFARNLRRLRLSKNLTQEQAAEKLQVSPQSVSRWECGSTFPDVMLLPAIARLYAVTIDDLYCEDAIGYDNYAQRLLAVYEDTRDPQDFAAANTEYYRLLNSGNYTMNDLRCYGILYQYHAAYCRKRALELYDEAIAMGEKNDPEMYLRVQQQKIGFLSSLGEGAECVREYRSAAEAPDASLSDYILMMCACCNAREPDEGLHCCQRAAARFPDSAYVHYYSGEFHMMKKQHEEAIACWDKTLALDPNFMDARHSLAECFEELGRPADALVCWREMFDWLTDHGMPVETGYIRRRIDRLKK
ncbi:MAG: helix-turn-helix domain-containing protein [Oscillospiraceae bacterium]|nr:helix-turn-helix domain-containing protein [Oscillospiraceae bacterium]